MRRRTGRTRTWRAVGRALAGLMSISATVAPVAAQSPTFQPPFQQAPQVPQRVQPRVAPQVAQPPGQAVDRCLDRTKTLGVARVIDIDTLSGPRFGHQQYKDINLLQDGEVALTFDDGPLRVHTQAVVDALAAQCTKATFFMVGSQALADPEMVKQIQRKGHTIGTHTWSHSDLRKLTPMKARQEIELGFSAVTLAAGQPIAPFFRFPFLADTTAMKGMAQTRGFGVFSIDVDALDYRHKDAPDAVQDEVLKQLAYQRRGILLFHDIQPSTAAALPGLLAALKAKGFRVVHLRATAAMETLPEFDAMARREFGAKRVAAAANPLANRAVTWPVPSKPVQPAASAGFPPQAPIAAQPQPSVAPAPQPWGGAGPVPQRPPARLPPRIDWRDSVFGR
jgi:peptidoglycan-N-acetylglucosamine deacetylase